MKVLSLPAPHALFAVHGYKTIHTPVYDTEHRGWLAIHANRQTPEVVKGLVATTYPFADCLIQLNERRLDKDLPPYFDSVKARRRPEALVDMLPHGAIVGVVYLAKTEGTRGITERWNRVEMAESLDPVDYNDVPRWEPSFGDFSNGHVAWWLTHPIALRNPVPLQGMPGLWDTQAAAAFAGDEPGSLKAIGSDVYEAQVVADLLQQGVALPDVYDPAFFRLVNRRGVTTPTPERAG